MLTIDSDGQHYASDIPKFVEEIAKTPDALLVGARNLRSDNMPGKNTFANKFSNFWFRVETGIRLDDTQSGFRLYPGAADEGDAFRDAPLRVRGRSAGTRRMARDRGAQHPGGGFLPRKGRARVAFPPGQGFHAH